MNNIGTPKEVSHDISINKINGKIMLFHTQIGIPNLLVVLYDVDPNTTPEEILTRVDAITVSTNGNYSLNGLGDRIGSVLTETDGSFSLNYEDGEYRIRNEEKRPDLLLLVLAPEAQGKTLQELILFASVEVRQNAGRTESYFIELTPEQLENAGLSAPTSIALEVEDPDAIIQKININVARQTRIRDEIQSISADQVESERQRRAKLEREVESRLLEKLSGIPNELAESLNYVPPGANVGTAMFHTLVKSIDEKLNKMPSPKGYILLSEDQKKQLKRSKGAFSAEISATEFKRILFGTDDDRQRPTFLIRENPADIAHRSQQPIPPLFEEEEEKIDDVDGAHKAKKVGLMANTPPSPDEKNTLATMSEKTSDLVDRLIGTMTSPEEGLNVDTRPTRDSVDENVSGLKLHSGPADVPAYYDFHSLEIAYDYVWQKAIDEGIIEAYKEASQQVQDMGGNPSEALNNEADPVKALQKEWIIARTANIAWNPTSGAWAEWKVQTGQPNDNGSSGNGTEDEPPLTSGQKAETGPVTKDWTTVSSTPELLQELDSLLYQKFAFDIFAPGSVNFGILVTYRQRWKPETYQVGNLVKTLTLTPKETRKVTAKQVVKKERNVKEMENSLRVRKEESNNTKRDEAEIIAKAEAKTNFSLTAQGTYNIGIAKGDSTTVFGKDAATNSSDTKKPFERPSSKPRKSIKTNARLRWKVKKLTKKK